MKKPALTQDDFKELLEYDSETGSLTRRTRSVKWFKDDARWTPEQCCKRWNTMFAGKPALSVKNNKRGCFAGVIFGKMYISHRIIWFYMTGENPNYIDHINGNPFDNRWENLRSVTNQENLKNQKRRYDSTSGVTGVSFLKSYGKWEAYIWVSYKKLGLGYFDVFEDAVSARKAAEAKYGFHPNHGRSKTDA